MKMKMIIDNYETGACTFTKITQSKKDAEGIYTIYPRQGTFAGMPAKRVYRLELLARPKPLAVKFIDGKKGKFQYNSATKTLTIDFPLQPCDSKLSVKVIEN